MKAFIHKLGSLLFNAVIGFTIMVGGLELARFALMQAKLIDQPSNPTASCERITVPAPKQQPTE